MTKFDEFGLPEPTKYPQMPKVIKMNERIEQLAEQCVTRKFYVDHASEEFDYKKFAELLVQECQERVEHYIRDCGEIGSLPDTVIMKHFGVDE